ncbi:hypothetical protein [Klebsiella sp. K6-243]|uniref:hypothetical protein n=1 Tax=Klebsiella sp. K6-243 TaxID=2927839 RepID=UPI0024DEB09E|nr:hypothetical protein [Klebsiella sp. K6-243]
MISIETVTPLNYRMAVSGRSDFPAYHNFPEVYHGQGITTPPFSGAERPISGQGRDTTYSVKEANNTAAYCVSWPLRAGRAPADPEQPFFGSQMTK